MAKAKPPWIGPNFDSEQARTRAVRALLSKAIDEAVACKAGVPTPEAGAPTALVDSLVGPLTHPDEPRASAAAELAFVLLAFCLAEGRTLRLAPPSHDLTRSDRVAGDRVASETLSQVLSRHHIPATAGALQSNTYRAGYVAGQARSPALREFVDWLSEDQRTLADVEALFHFLARTFADLELTFPDLPALDSEAFTFARTRMLIEALRSVPSQGAYEQYLAAAFVAQEFTLVHPAWRVETKRVGAADASAKTAGDVQVRQRQTLVHAIEVSASDWKAKVEQAGRTGQSTGTGQVTIVASANGLTGQALLDAIEEAHVPPGVDLAVVDIASYLDAVSARLTPPARASAIRTVYDHLVTWNRTRPDLVEHLTRTLVALGFTTSTPKDAGVAGLPEAVAKLRTLTSLDDETVIEISREDLETLLVWAEERLGEDG